MRHRIFARALLALLLAAAALPATVAAKGGNLTARVDGSFDNAAGNGSFDGTLTFTSFEHRGDRLVAVATLEGTFTDGAGKELGDLPDQTVTVAIDPASVAASCQQAKMTVDPGAVDGAGVHARLRPVELEIDANAVPDHKLDSLLCDLGKLVRPTRDAAAVAQQLDRILQALE
jgi:hypothetical protein